MRGDDVVSLTYDEVAAVALWLAVDRLADAAEWFEWEEVPLLSEAGHEALLVALDELADDLNARMAEFQQETGVDAGAAYWRAAGLPNPAAPPGAPS